MHNKKYQWFSKFNNYIHQKKFETLLISLLLLMFGNVFEKYLHSLIPLQAMLVALFVFYQKIHIRISILLILIVRTFLSSELKPSFITESHVQSAFGIMFILFFMLISIEVFRKILAKGKVSPEIISAVICGFIMICFIGSFVFSIVESIHPHSYHGVITGKQGYPDLLYFSVTNLLTLGLGDILPVSSAAKESVMLMGIIGHLYTVFVTSIIIGKYISQIEK